MTLNINQMDKTLVVGIEGRLDTVTAPELEKALKDKLAGVDQLVLNLQDMAYISSAGLRVLLAMHKQMAKAGGMKVKNASEDVMEIFDVTGFSDILDIE